MSRAGGRRGLLLPTEGGTKVDAVRAPEAGTGSHAPATRELRRPSLARRVVAEGVGTALLLATVIGSGIMGERLAGGNVAIALLANTLATGAGLVALILTFGGISGAHFNPAVTVADASQGGLAWRDVGPYIAAQLVGAFAGVALAHLMFGLPAFSASHHERSGLGQLVAELTATFGLPAVTLARAASDTFAGIRPGDAPGFVIAQMVGAAGATVLFRWLVPGLPEVANRVVTTSDEESAA